MKYLLLRFFFGWVAKLGCWLQNVLVEAQCEYMVAHALPPGTQVTLLCSCHYGAQWYVEKYHSDADDYTLVRCWPPPPRLTRKFEVDSMFIERKNFGPGARSAA